jgi:hypothetical protein
METHSLISLLDQAVPGFRAYAESDDNLFQRDSAHGVLAACSHFVTDRSIPAGAWRPLADFMNEVVGSSDADLDNAACTCFLENLASPNHPLAPHLRGEALAYWQQWCDGV